MKKFSIITLTILLISILATVTVPATFAGETSSAPAVSKTSDSRKKSGAGKKNTKPSARTSKKGSGKSAKSRGKKKTGVSGRAETAEEVRRRQEATQREIQQTREQIRENDLAVRRSLSELGRLESDINDGKKRVAEAGGRVTALQKQIGTLQTRIAAEEKNLARMRAEYLKAVKKMRVKKRQKSTLAFIFSSSSFNQAMRRMRYLREFSDWRDRQSREIGAQVAQLKKETTRLAQTKTQHDHALAEQLAAQRKLQTQYTAQDAIVVELKKNGQALHAHLANKQAEANQLKSRVAALIAEEQRKAEAERQAQLLAERKAQQLAEAERQERARAEAQRLEREEAERQAREQQNLIAQNNREKAAEEKAEQTAKPAKSETPVKTKPAKEKKQKQPAKKENKKENKKNKDNRKKDNKKSREEIDQNLDKSREVTYAEARRRRPRNQKASPSATGNVEKPSPKTAAKAATPAAGGNFASMRGALPRPVAGPFRVTSQFGTHSLPDMPNVTYDNPGIDAEVASGASAQAVYGGKVSGVYMIPGYATVIIVNHGGYYTVYGNISQAAVKVGDTVGQGQNLGRVAADEDNPGHGLIHFEVWKNRDKQNPMSWIR